MSLEPSTDLFFIVGTGRSGTTLLQRMLSAHPRITIPAETQFFSRFDPALRFSDPLRPRDVEPYHETLRADTWWRALALDLDALRREVEGGSRFAEPLFFWMLQQLAGGATEGVRIGEKTPHHEKRVARISALFPRAKFIHVVRDPRDVVASLRREEWWPWKSVQRTSIAIRKTLERQVHAHRTLGEARYRHQRFEDLVADPEGTLRSICAFLGEAYDDRMLRYHESEETGFLEREEAWKGLARRPIDPSRVGRWRTLLSDGAAGRVERRIGHGLMRSYGYEPSGRSYSIIDGARDTSERVWWFVSRQLRSVRKRLA